MTRSALRSLSLVASLGIATATGADVVTVPDPSARGSFAVTRALYDEGPIVLTDTATGVTYPGELSGDIHYPSSGAGPFPVIVFEHGRHSTCDYAVAESLGYPCPETPVTGPIESFAGYDYLADLLASHGYVVASLDANAVNTFDSTGSNGMPERSQLLLATLGVLKDWNAGTRTSNPGPALLGRLDMGRIGVMGHSRGGEGVATLIADNRALAEPYALLAVFALAAVDFNDPVTNGVHFAALAPLCDGDVSDLQGVQAYDRSSYVPGDEFARVQFTVRGANHNFFNTIWTNDDFGSSADSVCNIATAGSERLAPADQRKIGVATIGAFLRRYVGGEVGFDPIMTGLVPIGTATNSCASESGSLDSPVLCDEVVGVSYSAPETQRTMVFSPSDGPTATPNGFTTFAACNGADCPATNRSAGAQYTLRWSGPADLALDLGGADVSGTEALTFRLLPNADALNVGMPDFRIEFVAATGSLGVSAADYGIYALTDKRGDRFHQETMNGVLVPLDDLGIDPASLESVVFRFGTGNDPATGSIQLTEVGFQTVLPEPAGIVSPLLGGGLVYLLARRRPRSS